MTTLTGKKIQGIMILIKLPLTDTTLVCQFYLSVPMPKDGKEERKTRWVVRGQMVGLSFSSFRYRHVSCHYHNVVIMALLQ